MLASKHTHTHTHLFRHISTHVMVSNALLFTCICAFASHWQSQVKAYYLFHLYCPDFAVACRYTLMYMHVCVCGCGCECVVYFGQQQLNPNVAQCLPRRADPGVISHFNDSTELALLLLLLPLPLSLPLYASTVCLPLLSCLLHTHAPKWLTTKQQQKKKRMKKLREKKMGKQAAAKWNCLQAKRLFDTL